MHVIAEIVVLGGVAIYFYRKMDSLATRVAELEERLEMHDKILQTHEDVLKKISIRMNGSSSAKKPTPSPPTLKQQPPPSQQPLTPSNVFEQHVPVDMLNILGLLGGGGGGGRMPAQSQAQSTSFIEEMPDDDSPPPENSPENLDKELSTELSDLENS